ncbi:MAG: DUF1934 domain-containing protein [Clostridiaceae bacterium]|jgi:uncharacterized beta-barrel protein YwiB (DUF1934 family)|nr:DUF1934 domain-containing protein [Clostridiaceae bacterium]
MKVIVRIESELIEAAKSNGVGELFAEESGFRARWTQPAGEGEVIGARYSMTYDAQTRVLEVERISDYISRMAFCEETRTRGELKIKEGHFETEIFTHRLRVPADGYGVAELRYDLIMAGHEPISNLMVISVSEVKED